MKPKIDRSAGASKLKSKFCRLARVSVAVVHGRDAATRREIAAALDEEVPLSDLREAILQTYLFAGFPSAINGLWLLDEVMRERQQLSGVGLKGIVAKAAGTLFHTAFGFAEQRLRPRSRTVLRSDGEALCRTIYGPEYEPMIAKMKQLSPELAEWILEEGYGKVLSRPQFSSMEREFLIVPTLMAAGAWRQLASHLRGAFRFGIAPDELRAVVDACGDLLGRTSLKRGVSILHAEVVARRDVPV